MALLIPNHVHITGGVVFTIRALSIKAVISAASPVRKCFQTEIDGLPAEWQAPAQVKRGAGGVVKDASTT